MRASAIQRTLAGLVPAALTVALLAAVAPGPVSAISPHGAFRAGGEVAGGGTGTRSEATP